MYKFISKNKYFFYSILIMILPALISISIFFINEKKYNNQYVNDILINDFNEQVIIFNEWVDNEIEIKKNFRSFSEISGKYNNIIDFTFDDILEKITNNMKILKTNFFLIDEERSALINANDINNNLKKIILDNNSPNKIYENSNYIIYYKSTNIKKFIMVFFIDKNELLNNFNMSTSISFFIVFLFYLIIYININKIIKYYIKSSKKIKLDLDYIINKEKMDKSDEYFGIYFKNLLMSFLKLISLIKKREFDLNNSLDKLEYVKNEINIEENNLFNLNSEREKLISDTASIVGTFIKEANYLDKYVILLDSNLEIIFVTDSLLDKMGYLDNEILKKTFSKLTLNGNLDKILKKRNFKNLDFSMVSKNNSKINFRGNTQLINLDEETLYIQIIFVDITSKLKLYNQYKQLNKEFLLINKMGFSMTSNDGLSAILQKIVDKINLIMDAFVCSIRIIENEKLVTKAISGKEINRFKIENIEKENSKLWEAVNTKKIINIKNKEDIIMEDLLVLNEDVDDLNEVLYIPLVNNRNIFGVLTFVSISEIHETEVNVIKHLANNASLEIEKEILFNILNNNYLKTIESLVNALEEKLAISRGHTLRVSEYANLIAKKLYLKKEFLEEIKIASLLHDIGKIGISDSLLRKEYENKEIRDEIIDRHTRIGKKIIEPIGLSENILNGIYYHHIHFDLSGFPKNSQITEQPLIARIIEVADQFDVMLTGIDNHFKLTYKDVIRSMKKQSNVIYSSEVVDALEDITIEEFESLDMINN